MMVTFVDPSEGAAEADHALRGVAHATRRLADADGIYDVLASLSSAARALQQTLDQLAAWHERNAARAVTDDRDHAAGRRHAMDAGRHLARAGGLAAQMGVALDHAHNANAHIAWDHPHDRPGRSVGPVTPMTAHTREGDVPRDGLGR